MSSAAEILVVGAGLTGATLARTLADAGRDVLVLDRRAQIGGNVRDAVHPASGIRYGCHGPHYFRTNSGRVWEFVRRFARWRPYEARVQTLVDGRLERWPVTRAWADRVAGPGWRPPFRGTPSNFEEACRSRMPDKLYLQAIEPYTRKQWGVPARTLSAALAGRVELRDGDDDRLTRHRWQALPEGGYSAFVANLLRGIPVETGVDYLAGRGRFAARLVVFTGPIDEFYGFRLGRLAYRGQRRRLRWVPGQEQPCAQVNKPQAPGLVRTIEWRHLLSDRERQGTVGSILTDEYPYSPDEPDGYEYPFPDAANADLYRRYRKLAAATDRVLFMGRLGRFRYLDMDGAISHALSVARRLVKGRPG